MNSQQIADWIYDHLPAPTNANRFDREWQYGEYDARFYVGQKTNRRSPGFNLWLGHAKDLSIHAVWPASRVSYNSDYIGPEHQTQETVSDQANWQPKKGLYLLPPSERNYRKWQWRLGYANGFFGKQCGWSFCYYDGRFELWTRRHKQ